jgi:hypothetical protein
MELNSHCIAIIRLRIKNMSRQEVVDILQNRLCIQCYDNETVDNDFIPVIIQSIVDGGLKMSDLPNTGCRMEKLNQAAIDLEQSS